MFMIRSASAQIITAHPKTKTSVDACEPMRMSVMPNSSLKMQNGMPIVRLKKSGRVKNRWRISDLSLREPVPVSVSFRDMVSWELAVIPVIMSSSLIK